MAVLFLKLFPKREAGNRLSDLRKCKELFSFKVTLVGRHVYLVPANLLKRAIWRFIKVE